MTKGFKNLFAIILLWVLVHGYLLFNIGIVTHGESEKYIGEAYNLINTGSLSSPNFRMYLTQILLIFSSIKLHVGYEFVVAFQLVFSIIATLSIYQFASFTFSTRAGVVVSFLFLLNLALQQFNVFLQTDSLFYSFTIIFTCYLLQVKGLGVKEAAIIITSLIVISLTRPTGLLFLPPTFLYLYFRFFGAFKLSHKIIALALISTVFLYFLNAAIGSGGELDFMLPARDERIICGVPTLPYFKKINEIENSNSLFGLFYYITHNFPQFIRLAFQRSIAFFGVVREYYTTLHNLYLTILFFPVYIMDILSLKYWIRMNPHALLFIFSLTFFTWVTVILSCDDWHNRFFLTISPYLIILAIPAIKRLIFKNIY